MTPTPAQLLRLYPGIWRVRYGVEFVALVESTSITRRVVFDVIRAAAREWLTGTRVGRLVLGPLVAGAAWACAIALDRAVSLRWIVGEPARVGSFAVLSFMLLNLSATPAVGSLLIIARTRGDRRYAWLGLRLQVAALFSSSIWAQWAWLAYSPTAANHVWPPDALMLTWMLILLFNVDRSREPFWPWRPFSWGSIGIKSDWY